MNTPATLPIAVLRAKAAKLRQNADSLIRTADEIDSHIDALLRFVEDDEQIEEPTLAIARTVPISAANVNSSTSSLTHSEGMETSNRFGVVTNKWVRVLRVLAETAEREPFPLAVAADAVQQEQGKPRRAADIRRQFEPYLVAGYLIRTDVDQYQFTDRGFRKVGFVPGQKTQEQSAPKENEPSGGYSTDGSDADGSDESPSDPSESNLYPGPAA